MGRYPLDKYDAEHYAKWVANYILEKKLDRPVLVGHSMGSIIAAATAEEYPELINEKIVFMAPISAKPSKLLAPVTPLSVLLPNGLVSRLTTRFLVIRKGKEFYRDTVELTKKCASKYTSRRDVIKAAVFSEQNSIVDFDFEREALFIAGEKDRLCPEETTRVLAKKVNGATVIIEDAGHLVNYEAPEAVAEAIAEFLAKE